MSVAATPKRSRRGLRAAVGFVAAYALPLLLSKVNAVNRIDQLLFEMDTGLDGLFRLVASMVASSYGAALLGASVSAVLIFLLRTLARARVRAGLPDPLDRPRAIQGAHPLGVGAFLALPALLWALLLVRYYSSLVAHRPDVGHWVADASSTLLPGLVLPLALSLLANVLVARRASRELLAPTLDPSEANAEQPQAEGFTFDAVAVTPETRLAVAGIAALSAAMTGAAIALPVSRMRDPAVIAALAAYVTLTAGSAILFRRASRVSIGLDGVLVRGSSRTRFVGYRDIDLARVRGSDLELLRGGSVILRLQLHGRDAARRDALLARLQAAIAQAAAQRDEPATSFVSGASTADITRAADGGADYRQPAVSREQLWSVLEGPAIGAASRRAAAEALARTLDPSERTRLRVAAEQCAEPSVRVRMHELLDHGLEHGEEETPDPSIQKPRALSLPASEG